MATTISDRLLLNSLLEPTLIVTPCGLVLTANSAATSVTGRRLESSGLSQFVAEDKAKVSDYLALCSGSGSPVMGSLRLIDRNGNERKYRCYGNALVSNGRKMLFLRLTGLADDRFSTLTDKLKKLNAEIRRHLHTQAALQKSLRERELLIREMHHRVKNNIQILHGMLSIAAQETEHPEARRKLEDSVHRLAAIGTVQQTLYSSPQLTNYRADTFVRDFIRHLQASWPEALRIEFNADPMNLPSDVASPLALIANELLTNALKHGAHSQPDSMVSVSLTESKGEIQLTVKDRGPGYQPSEVGPRSSGIGLVRGLVRQLGGSFQIDNDNGMKCTVRFRPHIRG